MSEYQYYESRALDRRLELVRGTFGRAIWAGSFAQLEEVTDDKRNDKREPPVPPSLGQLSASLKSLVQFLQIDAHLL